MDAKVRAELTAMADWLSKPGLLFVDLSGVEESVWMESSVVWERQPPLRKRKRGKS